jgi:GT2 family glycosyltransferase
MQQTLDTESIAALDSPSGRGLEGVGVVLVGRNEAARLARAVTAACEQAGQVVYVDSNSTDESREVARAHGATVIHLTEGPYTPSRGRQTGFEELLRQRPDLPYVHFVDGDCVLAPGWVQTAYDYLEAHPDVTAVLGRRREERTRESFYSRFMDLEWYTPPGETTHFGGDCLVRAAAVQAAGGWSATTINAEDKDLAFRMRKQGARIVCLPAEMTGHDVRMTRFAQLWRRTVRNGYGYIEVGWRYRDMVSGRMQLRRAASALLYTIILPILAILGLWLWWPAAALVGLLYARMLITSTLWARRRGADWSTAWGSALLGLVLKYATLLGCARCLWDLSMRKGQCSDALIVYRTKVAPTPQARGPA